MRLILLVVALVLFILAGISAAADGVSLPEGVLVDFGLAAWVAAIVVVEPR